MCFGPSLNMISHTSSLLRPHRTSHNSSLLPRFVNLCIKYLLKETMRSPGYVSNSLITRPTFKPRQFHHTLALKCSVLDTTSMRVSPTANILIFEAKYSFTFVWALYLSCLRLNLISRCWLQG